MADRHWTTEELERGFWLGEWRVTPLTNRLERRGTDVAPIRSKVMQVLVLLAANAGAFVSKDAFFDTVWAGRVVTEDVLTGAIRSLRRALGDDARTPRFIETRKGVGYRLIAPIRPVQDRRRQRRQWTVAAVLGLLALLAGAWMLVSQQRGPAVPATIAVLPFDSLSEDKQDDYLASVLTDALILDLAERNELRVISRTSILPYAHREESLRRIATELDADFLVEGSVVSNGDRLQISAQLIDGRSDTHVWAGRYDRKYEEVLLVQNEVANRIASRVMGAVVDSTPAPAARLGSDALQRLLRARYLMAREEPVATKQALELFISIAGSEPGLAEAHLGMAQAQLELFKSYELPATALVAAELSATRALELEQPRSPAYAALGQIVQFKDWDFVRAETLFRRALELNPSDTVARRRYAWLLVALQRYDDALAQIQALRLLDPHYYASADGALLLLFAGERELAVMELERLRRETGSSSRLLRILATAYWAVGRYEESASTLIESRVTAGNSPEELNAVYAQRGRAGLYRYLLDEDVYPGAVSKAALHAQLGDIDAALGWLETAVAERDPGVLYAAGRPELGALHDHPRFRAIVAQLGAR